MVTVKDYTKEVLSEVKANGAAFVARYCTEFRSKAVVLAPVGKIAGGNLRNSIKIELYNEGGQAVGEIAPLASYAPYLEYGTSKAKAQPFMKPAEDAVSRNIDNIIKAAMDL